MKHSSNILFATLLVSALWPAHITAQQLAGGRVAVKSTSVERDGSNVHVALGMELANDDLSAGDGIILTPMLASNADTARMPAVEILGRNRYIYYQRNQKTATTLPAVVTRGKKGATIDYTASVPYESWMDNASLIVAEGACGCDQTLLSSNAFSPLGEVNLGTNPTYAFAYVQPKSEQIKRRAESGSAHLSFEVAKHDIRPDFGSNASELRRIRESIDLVRNDSDVTITGITLHGYASPDGSYSFNEQLAANRTQALRSYLEGYYDGIDKSLFTTQSTAEDWDSVRRHIAASEWADRDAMLEIIDGDRTPDEKDHLLANNFPGTYSTLYNNVYPSVRRTDYSISYTVRDFNIEEAREILKTRPQKLSLQEMYAVANSYETGSDDFNYVFDVAVRMFPSDATANLNAANAALQRGDTVGAEQFLVKAGDSPEAQNARGVLAAMKGDYATARSLFQSAKAEGLAAAQENYEQISGK